MSRVTPPSQGGSTGKSSVTAASQGGSKGMTSVTPPSQGGPTWFRKWRILLLVYSVGLFFGVREFLFKRGKPEFEWETAEGVELMNRLEQLDPNDPDAQYLKAMHALSEGDQADFSRRLDQVLASDIKHNELMLRFYADYLLATSTDTTAINAALTKWRRNFPYTAEPITFRLREFPRTEHQAEAIERNVAEIPWVADRKLGRSMNGGNEVWVIGVMVRRGTEIDVRDVSEAVRRALAQ